VRENVPLAVPPLAHSLAAGPAAPGSGAAGPTVTDPASPGPTAAGLQLGPGEPGQAREVDDLRRAGWVVAEPRWDIYYAVIFAASLAIVEAGPLTVAGRIAASAALAAMIPWYLFLGRPVLRLGSPHWRTEANRRGPLYLAALVLLFAVAQSQNPNAWFLSFAICPMCFHLTTVRRGMVFVVVFNLIAGGLLVWRTPGLAGALTALGIVVFAVAFSRVYTSWMIRVINQSLERAALIEQLESTRAELAAAHHEAGILSERQRLAGEIHDTLAQGFTSIVTLIQAAEAGLGAEARGPRRHLDLALSAARENLAEARTLVTVLSPAALGSGNLGDALRRVTESTAAEASLRAYAEVAGTVRALPTGTEVILLRVGQEALANVRKHAAARQVIVLLEYADDVVRLAVADDGAGFDPQAAHSGYGLQSMQDRVQQVGGTVRVTSASGKGTEINAEVPG
jgi:signal transduction histidine kinase